MNNSTLLLRQIHPAHFQDGRVTSLAFKPMPKDKRRLSCYDGDQITAELAFNHFIGMKYKSIGVQAVTVGECEKLLLTVSPDPEPFPEHMVIVFPDNLSENQISKKARSLSQFARTRGWLFQIQPKEGGK